MAQNNAMTPVGSGMMPEFNITPKDIVIAVMGVTGSGKSTFISHFSETRPVIGRRLVSCTGEVGIFKCSADGIGTFYLVDTPGFDDTHKSDTDILMELAAWLSQAYEADILLTGIIYLHRIQDVRLGGNAIRNLRMFKSLCGDQALSKVVLATTFWGIAGAAIEMERETELKTNDEFWGRMIRKGSKVMRQDKSRISAKAIIKYLVDKRTPENAATPLKIQTELVVDGKSLHQTGAGQEMDAQILEMKAVYEKKISDLRADLKRAIAQKDEEWKSQLEEERRATKAKIDQDERDRQRLQADNEDLKKRLSQHRFSIEGEFHETELSVKAMEYEIKMMREQNVAAEEKRILREEVQAEKNKLEMLRWKIRQSRACVLM